QESNYMDVPMLMRHYGTDSGKMWLKLRDDMPADVAQELK
ncbi:MAG: fatty acid metabolism transcriptional regulator FadR, partial [Shewanella sp.]